jgi:periplasmic divalent cation tolerance protein
MSSPIAVVTTVSTLADAQRLARALVEQRLAACAQISQIESVYRWQGALQQEPEYRVLFKTLDSRYAELEAALKALHPYELPAIHALPFAHVSNDYAEWIGDNTRPDAGGEAAS